MPPAPRPRRAWPLGLVLLVTTAIGTAVWIVEVATDGGTRGTRSLPIALIDTTLFAVDHGVHTLELGSLAAFERRGLEPAVLNLPLPAEQPADVISGAATYRTFDYRDGAGAIVFLLMLVLLVGAAAVRGAAGRLHRRARARRLTPVLAAAWGALVGPVWATALALLNALLQDTLSATPRAKACSGSCSSSARSSARSGGYLAAGATGRTPETPPAPSQTAGA